jgi:hypothetical protein
MPAKHHQRQNETALMPPEEQGDAAGCHCTERELPFRTDIPHIGAEADA